MVTGSNHKLQLNLDAIKWSFAISNVVEYWHGNDDESDDNDDYDGKDCVNSMRIKLKCDQSKLRQSFHFKKNTKISLQDCTDNLKERVFENNTQIINPAVSSVEILKKCNIRDSVAFLRRTLRWSMHQCLQGCQLQVRLSTHVKLLCEFDHKRVWWPQIVWIQRISGGADLFYIQALQLIQLLAADKVYTFASGCSLVLTIPQTLN